MSIILPSDDNFNVNSVSNPVSGSASRQINKNAFFSKIGYTPHKEQLHFHQSKARFRFPNCGRRFGKSLMSGRDMEPKLFLPNRLYWIVGPTYDLGEKEFRVIWDDLIIGQQMGRDGKVKKAYNKKQGNMFIQFPWNTRVEVRSADHPENLVGDALDWVIMSEAAKHNEDTWERFIRPALADRRGGADFPTTPEGYNWLYKQWMLGQDPSLPEYASWRFPSWANSAVYPGGINDPEIKLLKRTMTPEAFDQEIGADFGSFVGKIFPEWNIQDNVKEVKFNPAWPNYMAIDWGYTNPAAFVEFQVDPQDRIHIWRVHYKAYTRVEDHISQMMSREQPAGYHLDLAFADAADPEAVATVSIQMVPCIADPRAKSGSATGAGARDAGGWREGIDLVRSFIYREEGEDEFGGPIYASALFVDHSCVPIIEEFNNYRANEGSNGKNAPEGDNKSANHATDAIRYGLMHVFKLGATSHLSDVVDSYDITSRPFATVDNNNELISVGADNDSGFFTSGGIF